MSLTLDFSGKTVLVVGGTSGINLGIACGFARQGARLAVASRDPHKVARAITVLSGLGSQACGVHFDVRDAEAVNHGITEVCRQFGDKLDVLISGAAGNFPARLSEMSANAVRAVVEIDLLGSFHVMQAAYPHLRRPGAGVIHISAPQASIPMAFQSHVCAAKAGVEMLVRTQAQEWGRDGIRVNAIVPGPVAGTEGMKRLVPTPELMQRVAASVPLGRQATVEDIANAALLLSSPLAEFISGAILPVDGGWSQAGAASIMTELARLFDRQADN